MKKRSAKTGLRFWFILELFSSGSVYGADVRAVAALYALISVYNVLTVAL